MLTLFWLGHIQPGFDIPSLQKFGTCRQTIITQVTDVAINKQTTSFKSTKGITLNFNYLP